MAMIKPTKHTVLKETPKDWRVPENNPKPQNQKLYGCAIIDPPWDLYQRGKSSRSAERHYHVMKPEEIMALPVGSLMLPDAFIHMWVTNAVLLSGLAFKVLEAWGFTPVSILSWVKEVGSRLQLGNFYRNNTEHVILARRGKPEVKFHGQPTVLVAPLQNHSHKPEEYHAIARRFSDGPYLELFARRPYPGWDVWGNEVPSDIKIPGYDVPQYTEKAMATGQENKKEV